MTKVDSSLKEEDINVGATREAARRSWLPILCGAFVIAVTVLVACLWLIWNDRARVLDAGDWQHNAEIGDLQGRLRDAEARLGNYRLLRGVLSGLSDSAIATQQTAEVSGELRRVRASLAAAEALAESLRKAIADGEPVDTLPDVIASGAMQWFAGRRIQLNANLAELSKTLPASNTRIRTLRSQLAELDRQVRTEAPKLLASVEQDVIAARLWESKLSRELDGVKSQSAKATEDDAQLGVLEREATVQRERLETGIARVRNAASAAMQTEKPVIFDHTVILPLVAASFVAGLLLLFCLAALYSLFNRPARIQAPVCDVKKSVMAAPVSVAKNKNGVSAVADWLAGTGKQRVIVVSPEGDEASAATARLLRELADRGKRAILIDMTAHGTIGLAMLDGHSLPGITELLSGQKRLNEVIHMDRFSQGHIIPLGKADAAEAMRSADRLPLILETLETVYDFVIMECGPSSAAQIRRVADRDAVVVMSIVEPESNAVALAALDLDQGGYQDVVILMGDTDATISPASSAAAAPSTR